ncbi:unnamed protein product [Somion occarium]|uniref:Uncharacterized protein n=1 Tax=Somion occarium TaxID=3059160 RepID=A0ABP1E9A5_9APHY
MVPRFSNPHLLTETARHVSRAEIYAEPEEDLTHTHHAELEVTALASLESIVKRSLGDIQLNNLDAIQDEPKKKRRKTKHVSTDVDMDASTMGNDAIPFRLLSSAKEPTLVSLQPRPPPPVKVLEPASEDDEDEARIRSQRASEVAVDMSWLLRESQRPYRPRPREPKLHQITLPSSDIPTSPIIVMERPQQNAKHNLVSPRIPQKEKPSPHILNPEKLRHPIVELLLPSKLMEHSTTRRRRRRKPKDQPPRPPATFWRPMGEWGGKSVGYALGYQNSNAVWSEGGRWRPYQRDRMRKATFVV